MCNCADVEPGARLDMADWKEASILGFIEAKSHEPE
jgi:hypothetical protein